MLHISDNLPPNLWEVLKERLTENRRKRMEECAASRNWYLRLVLQDVDDPHNIAACLRSAEAFGLLNVDVVRAKKQFKTSEASRGASEWLLLKNYTEISSCVANLREQGFALAGGYPSPKSFTLQQLPIHKPIAIVFGNEHSGLDKEWLNHLDYQFTIPMWGMVESLNISVSTAISLFELNGRIRKDLPHHTLSASEQDLLCAYWLTQQITTWRLQYDRLV